MTSPLSLFIKSPEFHPLGIDPSEYFSMIEPCDEVFPSSPLNFFLSSPRQSENALNSPVLNFPIQEELKNPEIFPESNPPQIGNTAVRRKRSERIELETSQSVVYPAIHSFNNDVEEEQQDEFISIWVIPRSHLSCHVLWADGSITKNEITPDIKRSAAYKQALKDQKNKEITVKKPVNNWKEKGLDRIIGIYYWRVRTLPNMLPFMTVECSFYSGAMCEINVVELANTEWDERVKNRIFNKVSFIPQGNSRGMRGIPLDKICSSCNLYTEETHYCANNFIN